jgi:uncharacterized membrane protein YeiH
MTIIEYFLPYNNFLVLFSLAILNLFLISRRSYWQTFLIANLLILAFFVVLGFNPAAPFINIISIMIDFIGDILTQFGDVLSDIFEMLKERILDWIFFWR